MDNQNEQKNSSQWKQDAVWLLKEVTFSVLQGVSVALGAAMANSVIRVGKTGEVISLKRVS